MMTLVNGGNHEKEGFIIILMTLFCVFTVTNNLHLLFCFYHQTSIFVLLSNSKPCPAVLLVENDVSKKFSQLKMMD